MWWMDCLVNFRPLQPDINRLNPCWGLTVVWGGFFYPFGDLLGAPGVTDRGLILLGSGLGPSERWMDCPANFGPLQPKCETLF